MNDDPLMTIIRAEFEESAKQGFATMGVEANLERKNDGTYTDPHIALSWSAYSIGFLTADKAANALMEQAFKDGYYEAMLEASDDRSVADEQYKQRFGEERHHEQVQ